MEMAILSVEESRASIREMGEKAQSRAEYLDYYRPYSHPTVARHPVWSDALRAESAALREAGLIPAWPYHPWERDPIAWPSGDSAIQAGLLVTMEETHGPLPLGTADRVLTAVETIQQYGHTADHTLGAEAQRAPQQGYSSAEKLRHQLARRPAAQERGW